MASHSLKSLYLGIFAALFLVMSMAVAEAAHPIYNSRDRYNPYDRGRNSYLAFPAYPGGYQQNFNRDSFDLNQLDSQNLFSTSSSTFGENLRSSNLFANANFNQNLLNINEFATNSQSGSNSGSLSYTLGDGNQLTAKRIVSGNFRGRNNDFTLTEELFGGEQIRYNNAFANTFANTAGFNGRALTNTVNTEASLVNNQLNRDTATNTKQSNELSTLYDLQKSSFGSGFSVSFY